MLLFTKIFIGTREKAKFVRFGKYSQNIGENLKLILVLQSSRIVYTDTNVFVFLYQVTTIKLEMIVFRINQVT